ncbi:TPA: hypothetical protein HA244_05420 [Candidatus Micrarchaeota archaeon]|nr:hypothetical protein [Candidatus Micrarchaeota archaeon]
MKKNFIFALVLLLSLVLLGCTQQQKTYVCANGAEVVNKEDCSKFVTATPTPSVIQTTATPTPLPTTPSPTCTKSCPLGTSAKCGEPCPGELTGICNVKILFSANSSNSNEMAARTTFLSYANYLESKGYYGENGAVKQLFKDITYYGVYKNSAYWNVSYAYWTINGSNATGELYVSDNGDVVKFGLCSQCPNVDLPNELLVTGGTEYEGSQLISFNFVNFQTDKPNNDLNGFSFGEGFKLASSSGTRINQTLRCRSGSEKAEIITHNYCSPVSIEKIVLDTDGIIKEKTKLNVFIEFERYNVNRPSESNPIAGSYSWPKEMNIRLISAECTR